MLQTRLLLAYFKNDDQCLLLDRRTTSGWEPVGRHPVAPFVRDPYVARGRDGRWHLLFTESWDSQRVGHSASDDLVHWDPPDFPVVLPGARNCWAPEFLPTADGDLWYWSSATASHQAIWARLGSADPFLLFDPGYPVIDATIRFRHGRWALAFKDERDGHKAIRMAFADRLDGPYVDVTPTLTPPHTEGPIFWGGGIVYDAYRDDRWGGTGKPFTAPSGARHGSIITR